MPQNKQEKKHDNLQRATAQTTDEDTSGQQQEVTSDSSGVDMEQSETEQREQQLAAEQQKAETYLDLLRRTQAEFINYRRRASQEQAAGRIAAQGALLAQILPVLDDLQRALLAAPTELANNAWVQGLLLIERRLTTLLEHLGVKRVGEPGEPFDPRLHEAIVTEAHTDIPEGRIVQVIQPGYVMGERLVRPAQVSVAGQSSATDASAEQQDHSETE